MRLLILDLWPPGGMASQLRETLCSLQPAQRDLPIAACPVTDDAGRIAWLRGAIQPPEPDLVVACLPPADDAVAEQLFTAARTAQWDFPILAALSTPEPERLCQLLRLGASDFIEPPFRPVEIAARLWRWGGSEVQRDPLVEELKARVGLRQVIGESPLLLAEIRKIPAVARCDASVLLLGETGTGKELCARAIHHLSSRSANPFVPVNCGAIPVDLVENELFGHVPGAYTSATTVAMGLVHEADGGSLFLDEVDCLPLAAQAKLLRFLQEREFRPLGSRKAARVDVRIIAASNIDLAQAVRESRFRQDLYYRLSVVPLTLPPLRQRHEDIPLLARHFLSEAAAKHHKTLQDFTVGALTKLLLYDWPGNVRELENTIERAVIFAEDHQIHTRDIQLPTAAAEAAPDSFRSLKSQAVAQFERTYIRELLMAHEGNITHAARAARKNRRAFWELMRKHRIHAGLRLRRPARP